MRYLAVSVIVLASTLMAQPAFEPPVEIGGGIEVENLASPCMADWNGDGLADLIISEGFEVNQNPDPYGMGDPCYGHFRLYLNQGETGNPVFENYSYLEANNEPIEIYST